MIRATLFIQICINIVIAHLIEYVDNVKRNNDDVLNEEMLELFKFSIVIDNQFPKHILNFHDQKSSQKEDIFGPSASACFGIGRLGNQLCNFASQFALYKEFGINIQLSSFSHKTLHKIFQMKSQNSHVTKNPFKIVKINDLDPNKLNWVYVYPDHLIDNRSLLNQYKLSWFIKLRPETCDVKGFLPYLQELKQSYLEFKPDVITQAMKKLTKYVGAIENNDTIVSIHLRFTDMQHHLHKVFNLRLPDENYYVNALTHMKKKLNAKIVFLAFSDDPSQARRLLQRTSNLNFNVKFLDSILSEGETLALMSLAKGSILSHSTFGLWGALLRDELDNIILPKDFLKTDIGYYFSSSKLSNAIYL